MGAGWVRTQLFPAGDRVRPREREREGKAVGEKVQVPEDALQAQAHNGHLVDLLLVDESPGNLPTWTA